MFDSQNTWNYAYPTIDYTIAGKEKVYIDPLTGAAVKRLTGPGESYARLESALAFSAAKTSAKVGGPTPGMRFSSVTRAATLP